MYMFYMYHSKQTESIDKPLQTYVTSRYLNTSPQGLPNTLLVADKSHARYVSQLARATSRAVSEKHESESVFHGLSLQITRLSRP